MKSVDTVQHKEEHTKKIQGAEGAYSSEPQKHIPPVGLLL